MSGVGQGGLVLLGIITRVMPCREKLSLDFWPHSAVSVPKSMPVGKVYTSNQSFEIYSNSLCP